MILRGEKVLPALVALLAVAGCSDLGAPLRLLPHPEVSVTALDFGTVALSDTASRSVSVGNSGTADLHGNAAVSCPAFVIESGGGAFTVAPGAVHIVVVRFQPTGVGTESCQLTLGGGLPAIPLSGSGAFQATGALCVVSPASLDFGTLSLGQSKALTYKLFSVGTAAVILNVVAPCGGYEVLTGGGPSTLPPGDSLAVTVRFAPGAGGHFACIVENGPGCPELSVSGDALSVSFASQILPILNTRGCNNCHFFPAASELINVVSPGHEPNVRIKPFDLAGSVLYGKVTGTAYGISMPYGQPLIPAAERDLIKTWILEGAHDN